MRGKNLTEEHSVRTSGPKDEPAIRQTQGRHRGSAGVAVLLTAAALALAGCGGGSHGPHVASLPATTVAGAGSGTDTGSGSGSSATTAPQTNPTRLLDEWAACMRAHGDPGQADPTIDANKVIHITWNSDIPGGYDGTDKGGQGNVGPGQYCRSYLSEAQTELRAGHTQKQPSQAQLVAFSECMRANGIPDFPDPKSNGDLSINIGAGGDLNPNNPAFQNASKLCAQKTGVQGFTGGTPQPGTIQLNGGGPGLTPVGGANG